MFMPDQGRLFLGLVGDRWGLSCTCGRPRQGSVHLFFNGKVHPVLVCVFRMRARQNVHAMCLVLVRL